MFQLHVGYVPRGQVWQGSFGNRARNHNNERASEINDAITRPTSSHAGWGTSNSEMQSAKIEPENPPAAVRATILNNFRCTKG